MNDAQYFYAVEQRQVQNQNLFESRYAKYAQLFEGGVFEARMPAPVRLRRKKGKCVMGRHEETVAKLGNCRCGVIVGLVLKVDDLLSA